MNFYPLLLLFRLMFFGDNFVSSQVQTQVWLTVSPLADKTSQRLIEINWRNAPKTNQNDWIGIFTSDPIDSTGAIRKLMVDDRLNGYNVTDIQFPYRNFATGKLTQQCLGYYIAYIHNDIVFAKNCIKNNPFWMENNLAIIGDKTLPSLMIPGTHDSGAYEKWGPKSVGDIVRGFMIAHDESLYNQMVYGIRYLDMRVGYHNVSETDDKLWIVHGLFRTDHTLRSAAEQVRDFLKAAPKEIVIFDFHRFVTGFNDEKNADILRMRYKEFFDVVESELKDLMIPFSVGYGVTVNELIAKNKRVLIGFDMNARKYLFNEFLWPNVRQQWSQKDELQPLVQYFENTLCQDNKNTLRSAMAELTPTIEGVIQQKYKSLRSLAQQTNTKYVEWFSDRWPKCTNIIASDFFLSSNVVDIALSVNHRNNVQQKPFKRFHKFY